MPTRTLLAALAMIALSFAARAADTVQLYAAGSLKAAMSEIARAYSDQTGNGVVSSFGPSGLLRGKIEAGDRADLFASANMKHPQTLARAGRGGPVRMFARNRLCAISQPGLGVTGENLLARMLDERVRLGTSTPKADPSGDYALQLFGKAEAMQPGARAALERKSLQLTGGADSARPPAGRNTYGWVMETGQADIFLTYCTNAVLAKKEVPGLEIVAIPEALSVGADYGLIVLDGAPPATAGLADFILGEAGQAVLRSYGFDGPAAN